MRMHEDQEVTVMMSREQDSIERVMLGYIFAREINCVKLELQMSRMAA